MRYVVERTMVAHLWAHQSQDHARNAHGSFYFEGNDIYSYGSHFKCATIVTNHKNEKAYLITTRTDSRTTARHMSMVRNAIPDDCLKFNTFREVSCQNGYMSHYHYRQALAYIVDQLKEVESLISKQKTSRSVDYRSQVYGHIYNIGRWNEFWGIDKKRKATDGKWQSPAITKLLSPAKEDKKTYWCIDMERSRWQSHTPTRDCKHLQKLLKLIVAAGLINPLATADYEESLTQLFIDHTADPELWTKFQARLTPYARKREEQERIARMSFEEKQEKWRNGEIVDKWLNVPGSLEYNSILRVRNEKVETSMGVTVLKEEATRLWRLIKIFKQNPAMFHHDVVEDATSHKWKINSYENDILTAGCHRIPFVEMEYAAQQLGLTA